MNLLLSAGFVVALWVVACIDDTRAEARRWRRAWWRR